jgi:hypothetical protein
MTLRRLLAVLPVVAIACTPRSRVEPQVVPDAATPAVAAPVATPIPSATAPTDDPKVFTVVPHPLSGEYVRNDKTATIQLRVVRSGAGKLHLEFHAEAFWRGANPGQVNDGQQISILPWTEGAVATFREEEPGTCVLKLLPKPGKSPELGIEEEGVCGGLNVGFGGTYRRTKAADFDGLAKRGIYTSPAH